MGIRLLNHCSVLPDNDWVYTGLVKFGLSKTAYSGRVNSIGIGFMPQKTVEPNLQRRCRCLLTSPFAVAGDKVLCAGLNTVHNLPVFTNTSIGIPL
jgi:hypothetical protein